MTVTRQTVASHTTHMNNSEFAEERKELRKEYLRLLLAATVPVLIIAVLRAAAWRNAPGIFYTWPVAVSLSSSAPAPSPTSLGPTGACTRSS